MMLLTSLFCVLSGCVNIFSFLITLIIPEIMKYKCNLDIAENDIFTDHFEGSANTHTRKQKNTLKPFILDNVGRICVAHSGKLSKSDAFSHEEKLHLILTCRNYDMTRSHSDTNWTFF